jgi:riboflavin biosynthesis pyrimidine reductase
LRPAAPCLASTGAVDLASAYAFPEGDVLWMRAVFVSSVDGAATLDGRSGGLGNRTDRRIFALCRALADVVLVGAGTVRAEGYGPVRVATEWRSLREGRPPTPPIAVVSRQLDLDLSWPLFIAAPEHARTIVVTTASAPSDRLRAASTVADVIVARGTLVDPATAVAALAERGYRRLSCEGGPQLLAHFVAAGHLNELCLTLSPVVVCGDAVRITNGPGLTVPASMRLAHVLTDESYLFLRYVREHPGLAAPALAPGRGP